MVRNEITSETVQSVPANPIERIMDDSFGKLKNITRSETIIGEPISVGNYSVAPVTKISVGFVTGGGEYGDAESSDFPFAGASGAGMSVNPVCFLVSDGKSFKVVGLNTPSAFDRIIAAVPDIISKFTAKKKK